jgi:fibronectin-binding autotransporter adhesin
VLDSASNLNIDLNGADNTTGGGVNDWIALNGNLTLDGTINIADAGTSTWGSAVPGTSWRVINYSGTLTDNGLEIGTVPVSLGPSLHFDIDTRIVGQVNLVVVSAVPEASAFLAVGLVGTLGWFARKRLCRV